ncbi:MAG: ABC transporter permease subunit, partial [Sphaerochaetaceae bacterium]|nr:ABC transporter permease subunit [Sphaerochaetaceae bacterium]
MEKNKKDTLVFFLGIILIGCLIQVAGQAKGDRIVFPGVIEILKAFFNLLGQKKTYLKMLVTLRHLVLAIILSSLIGITIGMLEGFSPFVRTLLRPSMILLRSIPMVIMVVVIMVMTRYERVPVIATSLFLIPLISEATCQGYLDLDPDLLDVYRLESKFNFKVLRLVHLPLMAGYLKQAYISAVGMGMKLIVSTEYLVQTRNSLGKAINSSSYFNEYQDIYAYALIMITMVMIVSEAPNLIGKLTKL